MEVNSFCLGPHNLLKFSLDDKRYTLSGKRHDWATCPVSPFPEAFNWGSYLIAIILNSALVEWAKRLGERA